ncbi:MAG: acyl-CoA dehydrogenase family protein [Acidimicrobiia bacterium]|nr:acyl-CoA dehydrogenase family protein [Acidimicrobiia bacterium]
MHTGTTVVQWKKDDERNWLEPPSIYETEELAAIRVETRRFVEREVVPHGEKWEDEGRVPRELFTKLGEMGLFGLRIPESRGGVGLGHLASATVAEELGKSTFGGVMASVAVHSELAMPYLYRYASPELQDKYLPRMMSGEMIGALAVSEPDAGSDVAAMKTRAIGDGDEFVVNGTKMFISNGSSCDVVVLSAKTDLAVAPHRGITLFLVEKGTSGFSVSRTLDKHGWRSSDTAELVFEDCRVPVKNIIGERNRGFYAIMRNFQNERLVLAAAALGEAKKALEMTVEYVKTRRAFGKVLWAKQAIRLKLAELAAAVEAGSQLIYHSAWLLDQGQGAVREVSMVKAFMSELVNRVLYSCVQFHGGMGYMRESAIERMSRDARLHPIGGGATEVMLEEVAKKM